MATTRKCPQCGFALPGRRTGRPRLDVPVQNVLDALAGGETVTVVARQFHISRGSVYRIKGEASGTQL